MKTCNLCRKELSNKTFYKHNKTKDGLRDACKICVPSGRGRGVRHKYSPLGNSERFKKTLKSVSINYTRQYTAPPVECFPVVDRAVVERRVKDRGKDL